MGLLFFAEAKGGPPRGPAFLRTRFGFLLRGVFF